MKDFMEFISIPIILLLSMSGLFMSFFAYVFLLKRKTTGKRSDVTYEVNTKFVLKNASTLSTCNAEPNIKLFFDLRASLEFLKYALCVLQGRMLVRKSFYFSEYASCSIICNDYYVFELIRILV